MGCRYIDKGRLCASCEIEDFFLWQCCLMLYMDSGNHLKYFSYWETSEIINNPQPAFTQKCAFLWFLIDQSKNSQPFQLRYPREDTFLGPYNIIKHMKFLNNFSNGFNDRYFGTQSVLSPLHSIPCTFVGPSSSSHNLVQITQLALQ